MHENELQHYGVLGMKWGVRRARKYEGGNTSRKDVRTARREYNKSFNKAYNSAQRANLTIGKKRRQAANDKYVSDFGKAVTAAKRLNKTETQYKAQKAHEKLNARTTKQTQEYIEKNVSTGKSIAQSMILGSYGALVYNSARAKGVSRGQAAVQGVMNNWANNLTLGYLSTKAKW